MSKRRKNKIFVTKRSDQIEEFSETKLKKSVLKAGVSPRKTLEILEEVHSCIDNYFTTKELHKATYKAILKRSRVHAANYDIKSAIYNLGPSGYPFEILCAEMLKAKGFKTKVSVIKKGRFVKHEVDVVARREDHSIFCECKFHNRKSHKNDIKIPLYIHSRFLDIKEANPFDSFDYAIFTNTLFSEDAIKYAKGVGLHLFAMNYPKKNTFVDIIKKYKVYPITVLKSLRVRDRRQLLDEGIVVIKQVSEDDLYAIGLSDNEVIKTIQEITVLTRPN